MGIGKMVAGAGLAAGAAYAGIKILDNMDSDSIRECGVSIKSAVGDFGRSLMDSEIAKDLTEKINGTKYGPKVLNMVDSASTVFSGGFDKLVNAFADSKADAEQGRTSLGGALAERLTGLVADGAEYVAEHIPTWSDIGAAGGEALSDKLFHKQDTVPAAEPDGLAL